ncbi:sulfate adenylyltransferase subunit CysN [Nitriliruptor alkaliphilus]|uniref:sulfate adenylyltransferase subunit CysN n=1 Tax=Nitriliruptor alkaliphilus TaxID=427918 RepID=UPI00069740E0|nr:sulfate adenylyltransferase subunit CysN [Nitriliruptor alkaliphilus]
MTHQSDLIATDIEAYLAEHEQKDLLRLLTCGSVDDGKSTLIGRLLHDSNMIYADHLAALESDSVTSGTTGDQIDLALLMDGLKAEREQGITIDVAYRYFSTARRKFIIADTPGHVQYTRNMVTGASTAQLAIILVDARHGVLEQTRRHSSIASLLGIRHVVVAVNKMDLVDWSKERFDQIAAEYAQLAEGLDLADPYVLPLSALTGANVVDRATEMPWFEGPPLMEHLETVDVRRDVDLDHLRFPVQLVVRPDLDFRGFAGTLASGTLRPGDPVVAVPSGVGSTVARIVTFDGDLEAAGPGDAITVTLTDEIDVSRGDLLVSPGDEPLRAHDVDATVVWMTDQPARPGASYLLQTATGRSNASLRSIDHRVDIATLDHVDADHLDLNDIARCGLTVDRELVFDPYGDQPTTGSFILVDRLTNATVAAGMLHGPTSTWDAEAPAGLTHHRSEITSAERAARLGQRPCTVLFTGTTGSGKTTLAAAVERRLFDRGRTLLRLDGENLRLGLSRDLGFTNADRSENLRRAAEIAVIAGRQGLITLVAVQSPEEEVRQRARDLVGPERFIVVALDAPEEVRRARDPEGLYAAADRGEDVHVPGATSPYEVPTDPDLRLDTSQLSVEACVDAVIEVLVERGFFGDR